MTTALTLRSVKGSKLTKDEADTNFTNLRTTADGAATAVTTEAASRATADVLLLAKASNLSDVANAATARTNLGLGTAATTAATAYATAAQGATADAAQPADAELTAIAGLTSAANKAPYFTGSGTAALADLTAAGRALIDDADAAAQRTTLGLGTAATLASDTDTTLAANSDTRLATQKAVKAYVDGIVTGGASDVMVFKGVLDCSTNPNYPAANAGELYKISVAGKIGGASGVNVEVGDTIYCITDSTASGTQAGVGTNWVVAQVNVDGAVTGPASATDGHLALFNGSTGKIIKDGGAPAAVATSGSASDLGSGTLPAARMPALTGDVTTVAGAVASTLATVNSNVGSFTNASITVNAKGQVTAASSGTGGTGGGHVVNARLTLTSATPITTTDVTGATSVFWTPFRGNTVTLWDGSAWTQYTLAEVTIALGTLTSGKNYDVFGYNNSGTPAAEILVWTNDTTRATAVTLQDGRYCKSGDKTRLYLGTFRTTSTTTTEDSAGGVTTQVGGKRFLWNYYNRSRRLLSVIDTTDSWTYATTTWRQANAASGNKVEYVCGVNEEDVSALLSVVIQNTATGGSSIISVAQDSVTVPSKLTGSAFNNGGLQAPSVVAQFGEFAGVGYHYLAWLEKGGGTGGAGTTVWFGDNAGSFQSGMNATING